MQFLVRGFEESVDFRHYALKRRGIAGWVVRSFLKLIPLGCLSQVNKEIDKLIDPYKGLLSDEQVEEVKDLMYGTALIAEQEGVQLSILYAIKPLLFYLKV